jgi:molecular chaperone DnaK
LTIPIGIDLGTTFSAIARLDAQGRPQTLYNTEGDRTTPSVILFEGEDVIVGKEALKAIATDAPQIAECAKRDIGRARFRHKVDGAEYRPEVLEAVILNKLRRDAVEQIGPFTNAVITAPAYFDEVRRKATQDAGYMAGLRVLDIINEPTAAAIAYAYEHGFLRSDASPTQMNRTFLVYDLGGGTFDVTVMRAEGTVFTTLATDGDAQLGGRDWDDRLLDLVAERFVQQQGDDFRSDEEAVARLRQLCEEAKRTLSAREKATVLCDYGGRAAKIEISRNEFEASTADLLDRTRFTAQQTLKAAGLNWNEIDTVLAVGGSTRMPMVGRMLKKLTDHEPDSSISPDEAVAHGAALHAGQIIRRAHGEKPAFLVRNVNSHSLGVVGVDPRTRRPRNGILIPRNTPLPVLARRRFKTKDDGQESIVVLIVEGENRDPDACTMLGRCVVKHLPPNLPAKTEVNVDFRYKENGRLKIKVSVPGVNAEVCTELVRENAILHNELKAWRARLEKLE